MTDQMRIVAMGAHGPAQSRVPVPSAGDGQVLVRVHAAGLNRADLLIVEGAFHGGMGGTGARLGLEWAGEIVACGPGVTGWSCGDRVMGSGAGAFADYVVAPAATLWRIPAALGYDKAAALPIALQTTHDAIVTHGRLAPEQSLLVLGASSGVGLMALQVGRWAGAGIVIGTPTDPDRRGRLGDVGADVALDTRADGWEDAVRKQTDGGGADVVIDFLTGPVLNHAMSATRIGGRIVNVGRLAGASAPFDFDLHARRRLSYIGVTFRTRSPQEVRTLIAKARDDLTSGLDRGLFRLPIDRAFPLDRLGEAYAHMKANRHFGKIVLQIA